MVCVGPQAMIPPTVHAAKYDPEKSSIFLWGFKASILPAIILALLLQLLATVSYLFYSAQCYYVACYTCRDCRTLCTKLRPRELLAGETGDLVIREKAQRK